MKTYKYLVEVSVDESTWEGYATIGGVDSGIFFQTHIQVGIGHTYGHDVVGRVLLDHVADDVCQTKQEIQWHPKIQELLKEPTEDNLGYIRPSIGAAKQGQALLDQLSSFKWYSEPEIFTCRDGDLHLEWQRPHQLYPEGYFEVVFPRDPLTTPYTFDGMNVGKHWIGTTSVKLAKIFAK